MDTNWPVYITLSAMFFMEFAVWGAWMPVLAARLLGPLKMSGKQTGWIYATFPLASMVAPLVAGPLADKGYMDMKWILVASHLIGAGLLWYSARMQKFTSLFTVLLVYSMFYGATLPLANTMIFKHLAEANVAASSIFIWAPIAWALVGYMLTGWRRFKGGEGDGSDCLRFGAILSLVMVAVCMFLPTTEMKETVGAPLKEAFALLQSPSVLTFIIASVVVFGMMQFYFLGTARFMQSTGIAGKEVPGAMAFAQVVQAVATLVILDQFYHGSLGPKWTLVVGIVCWTLLYLCYAGSRVPAITVVAQSQALHGLAYVLFVNGAWMFVDDVAPQSISSTAQSLYALVTNGISTFLGTQLAGFVMDRYSVKGEFQWRKIFAVPLVLTLAGAIGIAAWVHNPEPKAAPAAPAAAAAQPGDAK